MDIITVDKQKDAESPLGDTTLSAQAFYQHDPLFVLLKDTLHLKDIWIIAGVMLLPGGVFLSGWFSWISKEHFWTSGDTFSILLQVFVLFPLLFFIYLLIPASIASFFNTLKTNGVISEHRSDQAGAVTYENFVQQLTAWIDRGWWTAVTLLVLACYVCFRLLLIDSGSASLIPYWFRVIGIIMYLPVMYVVCLSMMRLLLTLVFTSWLFSLLKVQIKPLHPDGSGGLGALGRILWISIIIMLWDALLLGAALLSNNMYWFSPLEMILIGTIYVTLTPSLLIGWLGFPHWIMVRARDEALRPLADEFQKALMQATLSINEDTSSIQTNTDRLLEIKRCYDLVYSTFPTWPLKINAASRLVVTALLPAVFPLFLPLITSLLSLGSHALGLP